MLSTDTTSSEPWPLRTWHLSLAYDGTDFHGWQIQPQVRTVQGELQDRLRRLLAHPELRTTGTSRTDAGVHALDQHVSFESPTAEVFTADRLRTVLNRWLPADIRIQYAEQVSPGLNVRFDSIGKAYTYCIFRGEKPHPLISRYVWHIPRKLDIAPMIETAARMTGEHDFASFAVNPKRDIASTVRSISRVRLDEIGDLLCVTVVGHSFLYKMVRSMVGYLVHVGLGRAKPRDLSRVFEARDRCAAADSAPATGLFLMKVFFDETALSSYHPPLPPFRWRA